MECIEKKNVELIETNDNSSIKLILIHKLNNNHYQLKIPIEKKMFLVILY